MPIFKKTSTFLYFQLLGILVTSINLSCTDRLKEIPPYSDIGDIKFEPHIDKESFKICHEDISIQFNYGGIGLVYKGEKPKLEEHFKQNFRFKKRGQSGYIVLRFIVNCEGKTGRYRMSEMGLDLKGKKFDKEISSKLMQLTRTLEGWQPISRHGEVIDYYQYLAFKLVDGEIKEILP